MNTGSVDPPNALQLLMIMTRNVLLETQETIHTVILIKTLLSFVVRYSVLEGSEENETAIEKTDGFKYLGAGISKNTSE